MVNINNVISKEEYNFLRTDPRIKDRVMFLTLGGSHAYGTSNEGSDIDVRGCILTPKDVLLGNNRTFEQYADKSTDTCIYSFNKLTELLCSCNPNTIEMLGCRPDTYTMVSKAGQMLLDNSELFLSQRAVHSFGGYANSQLRRLYNFLARNEYPEDMKADHILKSMELSKRGLASSLFKDSSILKLHAELVTDDESGDQYYDFQLDADLRNCSIIELYKATGHLCNVIKAYKNLGKRNTKKDDKALCKHMMHLVRLYLMAFDILEKHEINTYRSDDLDLLMSIRNGCYLVNSEITDEFNDLVSSLESRLKYDSENTDLPQSPDYSKVNDLMMTINMEAII